VQTLKAFRSGEMAWRWIFILLAALPDRVEMLTTDRGR
jgi:hypothetical protein